MERGLVCENRIVRGETKKNCPTRDENRTCLFSSFKLPTWAECASWTTHDLNNSTSPVLWRDMMGWEGMGGDGLWEGGGDVGHFVSKSGT